MFFCMAGGAFFYQRLVSSRGSCFFAWPEGHSFTRDGCLVGDHVFSAWPEGHSFTRDGCRVGDHVFLHGRRGILLPEMGVE